MSTRSLIGCTEPDGTVYVAYCHFDGYLNGVGRRLLQSYNSTDAARILVAGGDMSSVEPTVEQISYYSKRGEDCPPRKRANRDDFVANADGIWHEFLYLWDGDEWLYCVGKANGRGYTVWKRLYKTLDTRHAL